MSLTDWTRSETISAPDRIWIKWKTEASGNTPAQEREQLLLSSTQSVSTSTYETLAYLDASGVVKTQDVLRVKNDVKATTKASVNQEWISARLKFGAGLPDGDDEERSETEYYYRTSTEGPVLVREVTRVYISLVSLAGQLQGIPYWWTEPGKPPTTYLYDPLNLEIIGQRTEIDYLQTKTVDGRDFTRTKTSRWVALGLTSEGKSSFERWMKVIKELRIQSYSIIDDALSQWSELVFHGTEVQVSTGRVPVPSKPSNADLAALEVVNGGGDTGGTGGGGTGGGGTGDPGYVNPDPEVNNDRFITGRVIFDGQNYDDGNPTVTATYQMPFAPDDYFYYDSGVRKLHSSGARNAAIKFGQCEAALDIGHAYGQNIVTSFDLTPTLDLAPVYIRLAGIEGAFLLDAPSYAWGPEGMVVSSDLLLIGVTGYDGLSAPAASWLRLPVSPGSIGPAGSTTVEANPAKANTIAIPSGFNVRNLAPVFAALPTNSTDVFREWRDNSVVVPPTLVLESDTIAAGPTVAIVEFGYELDAGTDTETLATGPAVEFAWNTQVAAPVAAVAVAALVPAVRTGVRVAVPAAAVSVEALAPGVASGASLQVPAAGVALAVVVPDLVGRPKLQVLAPTADLTLAGLAPLVASGASVAVPTADLAVAGMAPSVQYVIKDPSFSSVAVLLHMDGANGGTTFTDSSSNARTVTRVGNAQISTAQSKFGGASALFDGDGDYLSTTISGGLGSGDFTLEFWYYKTVNSGWIFNCRTNGTAGDGFDMRHDLQTTNSGGGIFSIATVPLNQWTHVAICRSGTTMRRFIDGTLNGSVTSSANFSGASFTIGGSPYGNIGYLTGYIDDLRITKGVARYTGNFTPPAAAFPNA